jgi:hypothetical protein
VERDPSNAGLQRDLSVAYSKVGDVLREQGKLKSGADGLRKLSRDRPEIGGAGSEQRRLAARFGGGP